MCGEGGLLRSPRSVFGLCWHGVWVAWLRRQRDWLFRTNHAWEPVFNDWGNAPNNFDDFYWKVVERSYSFLAPRFMSYQEWTSTIAKPKKEDMKVKVW